MRVGLEGSVQRVGERALVAWVHARREGRAVERWREREAASTGTCTGGGEGRKGPSARAAGRTPPQATTPASNLHLICEAHFAQLRRSDASLKVRKASVSAGGVRRWNWYQSQIRQGSTAVYTSPTLSAIATCQGAGRAVRPSGGGGERRRCSRGWGWRPCGRIARWRRCGRASSAAGGAPAALARSAHGGEAAARLSDEQRRDAAGEADDEQGRGVRPLVGHRHANVDLLEHHG